MVISTWQQYVSSVDINVKNQQALGEKYFFLEVEFRKTTAFAD